LGLCRSERWHAFYPLNEHSLRGFRQVNESTIVFGSLPAIYGKRFTRIEGRMTR
jgi:hypothetical protein